MKPVKKYVVQLHQGTATFTRACHNGTFPVIKLFPVRQELCDVCIGRLSAGARKARKMAITGELIS